MTSVSDASQEHIVQNTAASSRRQRLRSSTDNLFCLQGPSLENVRSLSLAQQLATHYSTTFAKSQTLIHLSAI